MTDGATTDGATTGAGMGISGKAGDGWHHPDSNLGRNEARRAGMDRMRCVRAYLPPSTCRTWPLMKSASGLAKNSTALAMSPGVPRRRNAMAPSIASCLAAP